MCIATHEEYDSIDLANLWPYAYELIKTLLVFISGSRHVLLIYAYSAHMALALLLLLQASCVVLYALPPHTSEKTQRQDFVVFSLY